jgi:hypothetical protein
MHFSRKAARVAAAVAFAGLAAAGCQSSHGSAAHHQDAVSASAAARSDEAQITESPQFKVAEARAQQCLTSGGSLVTVWHCIAPPGHGRARDACVRSVLVDNLSSKARRAQIPVLAAACAEKNA